MSSAKAVPKRDDIVGKSDQELDHFSCGICHEIFVEPVVARCCGQTYCKACIDEWLRWNSSCPTDRRPLSAHNLTPASKNFVNLIKALPVRCANHSHGCQQVLPLEQMEWHLKSCPHFWCECGFKGIKDGHKCLDYVKKRNDYLTQRLVRYEKAFGPLPTDFVGQYQQILNHNYEQFLSQLNIKSSALNVINRFLTSIDISRNGSLFTISATSPSKSSVFRFSFELGKVFVKYDPLVGEINTRITADGNRLIQISRLEGKRVTIFSEYDENGLKIVGSVGSVSFNRLYTKI